MNTRILEYQIGTKIMTLAAIAFVIYGFFLYKKITVLATDIYSTGRYTTITEPFLENN